VTDLVQRLREAGKEVVLVSGGLLQLILPVAHKLFVPRSNIFAIELFFNEDGSFKDFDRQAPTSRSGGKRRVMEILAETYHPIIMIGDGATDLEARPVAEAVIGFGGNVVRDVVKQQSDWFITNFDELTRLLPDTTGQSISKQE